MLGFCDITFKILHMLGGFFYMILLVCKKS